MLAPKEALSKARVYLDEVLPDFAELGPKVEEMTLGSDMHGRQRWRITFYAYRGDAGRVETLADIVRRDRIEKVVSVASEDGSLIAVENPSF
jgi:nitroreductase